VNRWLTALARYASCWTAALLIALAPPAAAGSAPVTEAITDGLLTGTRTTTTSNDGSTTTTETALSGTVPPGRFVERHKTEIVTSDGKGNARKDEFHYASTTYDRKGGRPIGKTSTDRDLTYAQDGSFTNVYTTTSSGPEGSQTVKGATKSDKNGVIASGEETRTMQKPGGERTEEKFKNDGTGWKTIAAAMPIVPVRATATPTLLANERAYLPDVAGPSSQVFATFVDPNASGPAGVYVAQISESGKAHYYRTMTDANHHLLLNVAKGVTAIMLFKAFDARGKPDSSAATCKISSDATVVSTDPLSNAPTHGAAITRASSAYQRGGASNGIVSLQTRATDPVGTIVTIDGDPNGIETLAVSDRSVKARLLDDTPLGRRSIAVQTFGVASNAVQADIYVPLSAPT
jgi:hypothetical protein